ncbi:hypothetical protein [Streptomyces sp. NPDC096030]|uniref:hypothetical protein n=1 Tax=Streptomyces sp. NPDC096030 TaxID=3155423 RepID=UPI00331F5C5F
MLRTYTVQADGRVASCCGLGMRSIPELSVSTVDEEGFLARAVERSESDLLKLWIHTLGPDRVLQWAAGKDPEIRWEGMYGHHCQTCQRLYKDPRVRSVIAEHGREMAGTVAQALWLDQYLAPEVLGRPDDRPRPPARTHDTVSRSAVRAASTRCWRSYSRAQRYPPGRGPAWGSSPVLA